MARKVIIVGGVAGGASCAARLRRLDESAEIIMLEKGPYISFANCGLPYHVGGVIEQREKLLLQTPGSFKARFNVDVRVNSEVTAIDRAAKTVTVSHEGKTYTESYDTLVLSTGSSPIVPKLPGADDPRVMQLWTIPDMDEIIKTIGETRAQSAVVVGGGFIGLEMAENLVHAGLKVTLVEMLDQVMPPVDYEMAQMLHKHMADNGVGLALGEGVEKFEDTGKGLRVVTSKRSIDTDLVILAIGVRPNSQLAKDAGLTLNARGGIVVDDTLKTSDESIYAVGDAVETENFVTHERTMIPLAGPANKMGRMAADNILGMNRKYRGTQGASVAKIFDMTVASVGLNEKQLRAAGKAINTDYKVTLLHPLSHAGYYPGGMPLSLKVIFDKKDGRVLGAQAVGYKGVEKRIDVISTAMRFGATVYDLEETELCYAPPYSSAKDPVNMAGFSGANILEGTVDNITYGELASLPKDTVLIDVRTAPEVQMGAIPGSVHMPVDSLREQMANLDKNKAYVVYCAVGIRAYIACRMLTQNGFTNVRNLAGGYTTYRAASGSYTLREEPAAPKAEKSKPMAATGAAANTITIDACGLQCPGPVIKLYEAMVAAETGDVIHITSTDPGFFSDAAAWCARTKNTYMKGEKLDDGFSVWIKKGCEGESATAGACGAASGNDKSMVVFSGDLDKALASFIIANGAAAMGRKVTMFFTFWGLNILRRHEKVKVKKSFIESMFGTMMPRGTKKLTLSKMNMMGMGSGMMKGIMKKKNVAALDELIEQAKKNGVKLVACTMSMDVMGIHKEELIDGVDLAGVASYLAAAENSDTNLFI